MNQCQTNNQSIRQSIKESVNQWSKEAKNQWINEWVKQRDDESLNQWTNESVTQWINEPMNQWISHWLNKPVNQWMSEWINETNDQPINKSMNQWTAVNQWVMDSINQESVNQWTSGSNNESVNQWITESMNLYCESMSQRRISEWTNERMNELMDGRLDGWMSGLLIFVELLLHWATSSPRHLLSTTSSRSSHLSGKPVICIPASSAVASATYFVCSSSCYRAFSSLRLQSHLPGALQQHLYFATRKRANAFCHHPIANPQSRSVAPNRPVFARRWQCGRFCATPIPSVFWNFWWNRALTTVWCTFCGPHLPKVLHAHHFSRHSPVCRTHLPKVLRTRQFLNIEVKIKLWLQSCTTFPDRGLHSRNLPSATLYGPESVFTGEFTHFRAVPLPSYLMMGGCHFGGNANQYRP